jgi:hypothetical protein
MAYKWTDEQKLAQSKRMKGRTGGARPNSGSYKRGWYKEFYCGSSWELAYLIYCLEHNIEIKRCDEYFEYILNDDIYKYYPDFIINNNKYIEVKGKRWRPDKVQAKIDQFPLNKKLIIIEGYDGIKFYLNYVNKKYGTDFVKLYDTDIELKPTQRSKQINQYKEKALIKYKDDNLADEEKIKKYKNTSGQGLSQTEIETRKNIILNSGIDFTKWGWITKLSKLLNISHPQVRRFIKKYMSDDF